jgi:hypothetical protein
MVGDVLEDRDGSSGACGVEWGRRTWKAGAVPFFLGGGCVRNYKTQLPLLANAPPGPPRT